ncbi:MAG TPA: TolC family protein [Firmicutes bacterium]|nr:TolC family protein [Bacillota bacterium]
MPFLSPRVFRNRKLACMFIAALMSLAVITAPSLAQDQNPKDQGKGLTLQQAVELALRQGSAIRLASLDLKDAEVSYRQATADQLLKPSVLTALSAETAWVVAQRNYEMAKADIATQVEQAYYDVLKAERGLVLAQENLERAREQLKTAESKFKLGMVAQIDVIAAEAEVAGAEANQSRAEADLALARMKFNRVIGVALDSPVKLTSQFSYDPIPLDLEKAIQYSLSHRLEIKKAEDAVALKEKEVEVYNNDFTPSLVLEKSRIGLETAQAELDDTKTNIILEVRQNFESLKDAERQVPLQEKALAKVKENLRIAKARYDAGVITAMELADAQRAVYQAETDYLKAMFDYNVARAKFYKSLGMPLEERPNAASQLGAGGTGR